MRRVRLLLVACLVLAAALSGLPVMPVAALDVQVTECQDDDAFVQALSDVQDDGGGTITFDCGPIPVTITLDAEQVISTPAPGVVIDGGGLVTLSGGNATRHFLIEKDAWLELRNLTLSDGNRSTGGAIRIVEGRLTVISSTLSGNQAEFDGGAISNESGAVTITSSTLSGNEALLGGGAIYNSGTLTITNSTLSGNSAQSHGGAIDIGGGTVTIISSTLSGNDAPEGAAIFNHNRVANLHASIIDGGDSSAAACDGDLAATFNSQGYNLDDDGSCRLDPSLGDLRETDPLLNQLDDYGGATATHLPLPTSPVIDHIPAAACATDDQSAILPDQRGVARPYPAAGPCDIGSVEVRSPQITGITTVADGDEAVVTVTASYPEQPDAELTYAFDCDDDGIYELDTGDVAEGRCLLSVLGGTQQIGVQVSAEDSAVATGVTSIAVAYDLCANRVTGEVSEAPGGGCGRYARAITLPDDGPVAFCANRVTGELRMLPSGECGRTGLTLILPEDGPVTVCAHRVTGQMRLAGSTGCSRYEVAREIGGGTVEL